MTDNLPQKVPLSEALITLTSLMDLIDDQGDIDEILQKSFDVVRGDLTHAVTRRVCLIQSIPALITRAKEMRDEWSKKAKSLEGLERRVKEHTMLLMNQNPELTFKSDAGEFKIQKNPSPSLETLFNTRTVTITNVLSNDDIPKLPKEYLDVKSYICLDTAKIKEDLLSGHVLDFASLSYGQNLRIKK